MTASSKKPPCFDELNAILSEKPTTIPDFLARACGVTDKRSKEPNSFDGENLDTSDIDMTEKFRIPHRAIDYLQHLHLLQIQHQMNEKVVNQVVVFILTSPERKQQK